MEPRCLIYLLMVVGQIWTYRQEPGSLENAEKLDFLQAFESRLALTKHKKMTSKWMSFFCARSSAEDSKVLVFSASLRSAQNRGPLDLVRRLALDNNSEML